MDLRGLMEGTQLHTLLLLKCCFVISDPGGRFQLAKFRLYACLPAASGQESEYQAVLTSAVEGGVLFASLSGHTGGFLKHKTGFLC